MGVYHTTRVFEIDKKQYDLILGEEEYFIDMEFDIIMSKEEAEDYVNDAVLENSSLSSFEEMVDELGLVSSYHLRDGYCGIFNVVAYRTTHGDYVCAISYAY